MDVEAQDDGVLAKIIVSMGHFMGSLVLNVFSLRLPMAQKILLSAQ